MTDHQTDRRTLAAVIFCMVLPTVATWVYFVALSGQPGMKIAYGLSKIVQFGLPAVWVFVVLGERPRFQRMSSRGILTGIAFGAAVTTAMILLYDLVLKNSTGFATAPAQVQQKLGDFGVESPLRFLGLALFYSLLHSLLEEYYWRWFVFGRLQSTAGGPVAIVLSSLAFMSHHVIVIGEFFQSYGLQTWVFSFGVAVGGGFWAWNYRQSNSLYGPWVSHLIVDAGLMWIGYDLWTGAG